MGPDPRGEEGGVVGEGRRGEGEKKEREGEGAGGEGEGGEEGGKKGTVAAGIKNDY